MTNVNWERWARATGLGFVVLVVTAFIVLGEQPKVGSSLDEVASYYDGDRGRVLTGVIIFGIAFLMLLWFVGAIANTLRVGGEGRLAGTVMGLATAFVSIQAVGLCVAGGLALNIAGAGDEGVIQALNTLAWVPDVMSAYPLAGLIAAASIGLWRARLLPDWYGWLGIVAAVGVLLRGTNWATDGFWSPSGGYVFVTILTALFWFVTTSLLLVRRSTLLEPLPEGAAARPM